MTFQLLFENFKALSNGTDAFKRLKQQCEESIRDTQNQLDQSALFMIYGFAKNYVLLYEDQEITPDFAEKAKHQLLNYMTELNQALLSQDSNQILNALNHVAIQYFQSSRIF